MSTALDQLPYLTTGLPPIHAAIKRRYEDFVVDEIPAYEPAGQGDHCYFRIEKAGLATMRAVNDIARALGVNPRDIGLAGLKDARGVTRQTLSLEHCDPARIQALSIPRIRILSVSRHHNKLRIGHLRGNRFCIRLREVDPGRVADVSELSQILARRGAPNYFGQQRFGSRGDTWMLGEAILKQEHHTMIDLMLGRPGPSDTGQVLEARRLYDAGDFEAAARAWPFGFRDNVRACREMARTGGRHKRAFHAVDQRLKSFFVNSFQSHLFNQVLAQRINEIDQVRTGDLAFKHDSGAVFRVEDEAAEAPRAAAFEISPSGPIFGQRMTRPEGEVDAIEQAVLRDSGIDEAAFKAGRNMKLHGSRRPLRFRPHDLEVEGGRDEHGDFIELRFALDSGCYATMILREICKQDLEEGQEEE